MSVYFVYFDVRGQQGFAFFTWGSVITQNCSEIKYCSTFLKIYTVFHSFPEGHLDRRGESGQEQSWDEGGRDLLTLLSSRLRRGRWGLSQSCSPPGLSCRDLSLVLFACSLSQAADRKGLGSVNAPLSLFITLFIHLNEHLWFNLHQKPEEIFVLEGLCNKPYA